MDLKTIISSYSKSFALGFSSVLVANLIFQTINSLYGEQLMRFYSVLVRVWSNNLAKVLILVLLTQIN